MWRGRPWLGSQGRGASIAVVSGGLALVMVGGALDAPAATDPATAQAPAP